MHFDFLLYLPAIKSSEMNIKIRFNYCNDFLSVFFFVNRIPSTGYIIGILCGIIALYPAFRSYTFVFLIAFISFKWIFCKFLDI